MPISPYLKTVREKVGHHLLAMTAVSISIFDAERRLLLGRDTEMAFWTCPVEGSTPMASLSMPPSANPSKKPAPCSARWVVAVSCSLS
jgi:hypothetical protein